MKQEINNLIEEPYINCSELSFSKMFTTGSLGDYLGIPTRNSYYSSSTSVSSSVQACSADGAITLVNSSRSWDSIVSNLGFRKSMADIPGASCAKVYDDSSTVVLRTTTPLKVQRYTNANIAFEVINNTKRDYVSRGLLVGITPGNSVIQTWDFNIPFDSHAPAVKINIPIGNMVNVFNDQDSTADGIDFFILLSSADMPKLSIVATSSIKVFDSPVDSEVTFETFPFKSQLSGSSSYPRLLAYRFRAYESVYNAVLS